jgi:hypothetical protein
MKRLTVLVSLVAMLALASLAATATPAGAYGGGANHDMWQIGISGNCNNPSFCGEELGGFWGWVEFDRSADGTITGDAKTAGCFHLPGGAGGGGGGAEFADIDITSAHIGPAGPEDPNPGGQVFYVDANVVNGVTNDPDFLGDSGIPVEAGHYSFHPVAGVAFELQVAFRPAK